MNRPSPEVLRKIEKNYPELNKFWDINPQTKEIYRIKSKSKWESFKSFFWKKKHTIKELYFWIKYKWAKTDASGLDFPIEHDNMPVKGFPFKFRLINGWNIPKSDLKYLTNGPLASEDFNAIYVHHNIGLKKKLFKIFRQYGVIICTLAATFAVYKTIKEYWDFIISLIN